MARKKSMIIYFDNYHQISDLPDEQLGILFRALMECGELEAGGQDGITGFELRHPDMSAMTRMAFRFMADNVRRDAAAYNEKCSNYRAAAQRRWEDEKYRARFEAAGGSDRKGNGGWNRPSAEPASPDSCLTFYMQQLRRRRQEQMQESAPASAPVD